MLCNRVKDVLPLTIVLVNDDTEARDILMLPTSGKPQVLLCCCWWKMVGDPRLLKKKSARAFHLFRLYLCLR
jgi:hypothetical protein